VVTSDGRSDHDIKQRIGRAKDCRRPNNPCDDKCACFVLANDDRSVAAIHCRYNSQKAKA